MFGSSNPFGQSSGSSPFASQSLFGQTSNSSSNNPFGPATQFGTSTPFGAQTGSSIFGSTSTGFFGAPQASSPFGSTPTFGASSSPAFGSSTPTFGASPASSPFGGSTAFWQKPLGLSAPQSNPFGSTGQQSQPAFGNSTFGSSTPFGATNTPAFGASSTPSFGATSFGVSSTPAFGASSTPAFGASSSPSFGVTSTPAFGTSPTPAFGNTGFGSGGAFGASSTPAFSASGTPAFGASSTPAFGASSTPAFGASSTPAFGASSTPSFGASNTSSFSFGSSPAFGQSTSAFGSSAFGSTPSPFGGAQASTPTFWSPGFGQSPFGSQQGGSRAVPYAPTVEAETESGQVAGKLESISAMPAYKDKSHKELRWEDYQRGDKGGPAPAGQSPGNAGFGISTAQANPFSPSPAFGQTSANPTNPFSSTTSTNPFAAQTPAITSSINQGGNSPSILYGISTMPVVDKPAPVRISSLPNSRHILNRRTRLPSREYRPTAPVQENGKSPDMGTDAANHDNVGNGEVGATGERTHPSANPNQKQNGTTHSDQANGKDRPHETLNGQTAGEASTVHEHSTDIEAMMPKLHQADYYTEPRIHELAAKERADPGYCKRVKDFVVGRHGFGSIKFIGETDVRRLDLESLVQFNNREVIVYTDESSWTRSE